MNPAGLLFVAVGLFSAVAAACDWDWFINNYKARLFVSLFGRTGARVFYILLGGGLIVLGSLITVGVLDAS